MVLYIHNVADYFISSASISRWRFLKLGELVFKPKERIFSLLSTGGVGIKDMIEKIEQKDYMGFENLCTYES